MKIFNVENKRLKSVFSRIVFANLNERIASLKFVGGGSNGKVFKAILTDGSTVALKAYRVQGAMKEEVYPLTLLSANTSIDMPKVLFAYEDTETEVLCMSFIKGSNVLNPLFLLKSKKEKEKFAEVVISSMLSWHNVCGEKYGNLQNPEYDSWCEFYREQMQKPWLNGLRELTENGKFSKRSMKLLYDATELFNSLCEEPDAPVLIHGDFNIMNIMADLKTFNVTGFIDPSGSMWADREYDLFQLQNMWGNCFGLYKRYKTEAKLSEYSDFRVAYYGAMNEAHCRLNGGLIMPLWEFLCNRRLRKEMKKLKEKM